MNSEKIFIALLLSLTSLFLYAQENNTLRGRILFQSSNRKPAVGVAITGAIEMEEKANKDFTTANGEYRLVFPNGRVGYNVALYIGKNDKDKKAIEVVNLRELEECRIPGNATEQFLIIVCHKGERDFAAEKYYKIIKTSSAKELAKMKKELKALLTEQNKNYEQITAFSARINQLERQTDSLTIYREAFRLASINRDFATDRVRQFLDSLDAGVSIQKAREILSIQESGKEADEAIEQFWAAIDEMSIWAKGSVPQYDYKNTVAWYDTVLVKMEKMGIDREKMAHFYTDVATIREQGGQPEKALPYSLKAMGIFEQVLDSLDVDLAYAYKQLSTTYLALNAKEEALDYALRAYQILKEQLQETHPDLMVVRERSYDLLHEEGLRQFHQKNYAAAVTTYTKALQHFEESDFYRSKGLASYYNGQYTQAIEAYQKAGKLNPTLWGNHLWSDIGHPYLKNKDLQSAKAAYESYEILYPQDEQTFRNWAMYFALKGKTGKALENLKKAIALGLDDMVWLKNEDSLAKLRERPAFSELLTNLKKQ